MQPIGDNTVNVPAFLSKLWKMVCDPNTDHLICWSPSGTSFIIQNQAQFWYELLPLHYKHNNMSSFVRQLNMYGFHKMSSVENGAMDMDKDEIQFYHPYFQKDQPELLKLIKRKVTGTKHTAGDNVQVVRNDELAKVLTDVKQIRGRQASVDSQLSAMKHENAVLWRELAMLRQQHKKQQQIVNKLIQFLVSMVQPSRMGVGVKRRYPLMLHASPAKKSNKNKEDASDGSKNDGGPTIHELDEELDDLVSVELYEDEEGAGGEDPLVYSPLTPSTSSNKSAGVSSPLSTSELLNDNLADVNTDADKNQSNTQYVSKIEPLDTPEIINPDLLWEEPEYTYEEQENLQAQQPNIEELLPQVETPEELLIDNLQTSPSGQTGKVFLNPASQDTMLSNLINGSYNTNALNTCGTSNKDAEKSKKEGNAAPTSPNSVQVADANMAVATRNPDVTIINNTTNRTNDFYSADLDNHLETTQAELDQLKDMLNGCNSFDANALLGDLIKKPIFTTNLNLFSDDAPDYGISFSQEMEPVVSTGTGDPMLSSGSELTPYGLNLSEIDELFDESLDAHDPNPAPTNVINNDSKESQLNTPQVVKVEPIFPTNSKVQKK